MTLPRSRFQDLILATDVLKRRAMDDSVSPRFTRYTIGAVLAGAASGFDETVMSTAGSVAVGPSMVAATAGALRDVRVASSVAGAPGMTSDCPFASRAFRLRPFADRSEEHTSELQSQSNLVCRL